MAIHVLRRAALRTLSSTKKLACNQSTLSRTAFLTNSIAPASTIYSRTSPIALAFRRAYATEQRDLESEAKSEEGKDNGEQPADSPPSEALSEAKQAAESTVESVSQRATEASSQVQSAWNSATETVQDSVGRATDAVRSAVSEGIATVTPSSRRDDRRSPRGGFQRQGPEEDSTTLYIGNLYFEVSESTLKKEFGKFGTITSLKIIYDGRGLSKGFGYVAFEKQADATAARNELDGKVFEGRRLAVQWAAKKTSTGPRTSEGYINAPSKTLFIGNMSYEMSDKDLNDLFRGIKNVLDVRVAIDRRTGQPRGFAHADFIDVASAQAAAEYLKNKEFYGRNLRIDFSANAAGKGGADQRERH